MTESRIPVADFRSDTLTQPSPGMRLAMSEAIVGDDVFSEDPTIQELQAVVAAQLGFEAGLFFPTGCMANLTALMSHTRPGQLLLSGKSSHICRYELGSYARIAGLSLLELDDTGGYLKVDEIAERWPGTAYYYPQPGLISIENTHNMLGGLIYPLEQLRALSAFARDRSIPLHMDGARLWHAALAENREPREWTSFVDSAMVCFSKGLGAPVGSLLAGSRALIETARGIRKLLGGGMRQSGVLAAAARFALDHQRLDLIRDHRHCSRIYQVLRTHSHLIPVAPQTNILICETPVGMANLITNRLETCGIRILAISASKIRIVFHRDNRESDIDRLQASLLDPDLFS